MERESPLQPQTADDVRRNACDLIRGHLDRGAPWDACDAFREQVATFPRDPQLLYWGALAHARAGATRTAHAILDRAESVASDVRLRAEILSLRGRLWKDALHRATGVADAQRLALRARDQYRTAYDLACDPYPGINAATLSMLLGDRAAARQLATELLAGLSLPGAIRTAWDFATRGEAQVLLGALDDAAQSYADAYRGAGGNAGDVATMRRQLSLIARVMPEAAALSQILPSSDVVAFAGHMVDAPGRPAPRFPARLVPAVKAALRERLSHMRRPIAFTSAACGADLLFIEAALECGAEVNVVLPFEKDEFVRTSVAPGGAEWVPIFDLALARAARVIMATEESHLGDDVLFAHAAALVEGLSMLRASQLQTEASLLCVLDSGEAPRVGGTRETAQRWTRYVGPPMIIDLRAMRLQPPAEPNLAPLPGAVPMTDPNVANHRVPEAEPAADAIVGPRASSGPRPQRTLQTMLFADFAGYSRLHDAFAPLFQRQFLDICAGLVESSPASPLEAKTWGDALYAVFASPRDGAEFALRLLDKMLAADWVAAGLPETSQIRIALHAGPVFRSFDPIMGRDSYFGSNVTRAARIEPVTPPGMIYASEAFAAVLASTGEREFALEYIGNLALAKAYGASRIYRLDRA